MPFIGQKSGSGRRVLSFKTANTRGRRGFINKEIMAAPREEAAS